jgi:hypothetical protein
MPLEKEKFRLYELDKKKRQDVVSVKLNEKERLWLEHQKELLQQEKDATALKQLAMIGSKVILNTPAGEFFQIVLENIRRNKRIGIEEVESKKLQK